MKKRGGGWMCIFTFIDTKPRICLENVRRAHLRLICWLYHFGFVTPEEFTVQTCTFSLYRRCSSSHRSVVHYSQESRLKQIATFIAVLRLAATLPLRPFFFTSWRAGVLRRTHFGGWSLFADILFHRLRLSHDGRDECCWFYNFSCSFKNCCRYGHIQTFIGWRTLAIPSSPERVECRVGLIFIKGARV